MNTEKLTGELTNWPAFCANAPHSGTALFGFKLPIGDVNRFRARYRVAKCFRGVELEDYREATTAGYSALCRVMFVWSAFETFLQINGIKPRDVKKVASDLEKHGSKKILSQIQRIDKGEKFYRFIDERVNPTHKDQLADYFKGNPCNIAYLASAIRHIFAHGWLSPNANEVDPKAVVEICDVLSDFLLTFMDTEFSRHVYIFSEKMAGSPSV